MNTFALQGQSVGSLQTYLCYGQEHLQEMHVCVDAPTSVSFFSRAESSQVFSATSQIYAAWCFYPRRIRSTCICPKKDKETHTHTRCKIACIFAQSGVLHQSVEKCCGHLRTSFGAQFKKNTVV